ncbi:GNAT family N-acetyltransferase [Magnetococcales bacterium HHB-1]
MLKLHIRKAKHGDLPMIVQIYNQAVAMKGATADLSFVTVMEREAWFESHQDTRYPLWVVETEGKVCVGWCSLSPHRPGREALRYVAEVSYFVHEDFRRRGVGSFMLEKMLKEAKKIGFRHLFAYLLEVNHGSIALLERWNFVQWGALPQVAVLSEDRVCSHKIYGRALD